MFISFVHNVILLTVVSAQSRVVAYCSMGEGMCIVGERQECLKLEFVLKVFFFFFNRLRTVSYKCIHSEGHDLFKHIK